MELIDPGHRITDPDRSVAFYQALGFEERRRMPIRDEAINIFMGLPGDGDRLELTYNFGVDCRTSWAPVTGTLPSRSPTSTAPSSSSPARASNPRNRRTPCARAARACVSSRDPDGYRVELIERG